MLHPLPLIGAEVGARPALGVHTGTTGCRLVGPRTARSGDLVAIGVRSLVVRICLVHEPLQLAFSFHKASQHGPQATGGNDVLGRQTILDPQLHQGLVAPDLLTLGFGFRASTIAVGIRIVTVTVAVDCRREPPSIRSCPRWARCTWLMSTLTVLPRHHDSMTYYTYNISICKYK